MCVCVCVRVCDLTLNYYRGEEAIKPDDLTTHTHEHACKQQKTQRTAEYAFDVIVIHHNCIISIIKVYLLSESHFLHCNLKEFSFFICAFFLFSFSFHI